MPKGKKTKSALKATKSASTKKSTTKKSTGKKSTGRKPAGRKVSSKKKTAPGKTKKAVSAKKKSVTGKASAQKKKAVKAQTKAPLVPAVPASDKAKAAHKETSDIGSRQSEDNTLKLLIEEFARENEHLDDALQADLNQVELLTFRLLGKHYAFRANEVEAILQNQKATRVPLTRRFVVGITTVRGKILPVIDIAVLMGADEKHNYLEKSKIVIIKGPDGSVGVRMQRKVNIVSLPEDDLQPPPGHLSEADGLYIQAVVKIGDNFVSVLDTNRLLSEPVARGEHEREA